MGFYMLGWLIAQHGLPKIKTLQDYCLGLLLLFIMILYSCDQGAVEFNPILGIFMALVGIAFSWILMVIFQKMIFAKSFFVFIGQHTMAIFIWHVLAFKLIEYALSIIFPEMIMTLGWSGSYALHPLPLIMLYTVGGVLLPLVIIQIKTKFIKLI